MTAYSDASFAPSGGQKSHWELDTALQLPGGMAIGKAGFHYLDAESELVAVQETYVLAQAVQAVMVQFLRPSRINLFVNNMAAISLGTRSDDGAGSWRTRLLNIRSAYLRENVSSGELSLQYVPGSVQLADILTKAVPVQRHREITTLWGLAGSGMEKLKARLLSLVVLCGCCWTVEGAPRDNSLALDTSFEFYVVVTMAAISLLAIWEMARWMFWAWWRGSHPESRHARRLRRLRDAVEVEIAQQLADVTTPRQSGTATSSARSFSPMPALSPTSTMMRSTARGSALERGIAAAERQVVSGLVRTQEVGIQAQLPYLELLPPEPVPRLEIREVYPEEFYMTQHEAHVHVHRDCWGLRNATNIIPHRICECCRNNAGRTLYDRAGG